MFLKVLIFCLHLKCYWKQALLVLLVVIGLLCAFSKKITTKYTVWISKYFIFFFIKILLHEKISAHNSITSIPLPINHHTLINMHWKHFIYTSHFITQSIKMMHIKKQNVILENHRKCFQLLNMALKWAITVLW